ncbi:MAG: hypothetical protein HY744_17370 [Deltaproteobacteria bacterium]|nr:hypothetical protein [Deltaproteobacteria bacterium]
MQFWIRAIEHYYMPHLAAVSDPAAQQVGWTGAKQDLAQVFPSMPADAWDDDAWKGPGRWLQAATTVWGALNDVAVWIKCHDSYVGSPCHESSGSTGNFPEEGRVLTMSGTTMSAQPRYTLAHELGHYLGLRHTFATDPAPDPKTLQARTAWDRWDLVYKPGTSPLVPHRYFASRSEADDYPAADLRLTNRVHIQRGHGFGAVTAMRRAVGRPCRFVQAGLIGCRSDGRERQRDTSGWSVRHAG